MKAYVHFYSILLNSSCNVKGFRQNPRENQDTHFISSNFVS